MQKQSSAAVAVGLLYTIFLPIAKQMTESASGLASVVRMILPLAKLALRCVELSAIRGCRRLVAALRKTRETGIESLREPHIVCKDDCMLGVCL